MAYTTINKSSQHFTNKVYTGNGSARNITGLGFQPDFTIVKRKNNSGVWYNTDIVRGAGKQMYLNETGAMGGSVSTSEITGFNSDGFNLGTDGGVNASGGTYTSFNFFANNTTGSSNTDGDVTSTVSVNTTAGFSIVKWDSTGTAGINIGHGLGQKPAMIIAKCLNQSSTSWAVYHQSLGATKYYSLQSSTAATTSATRWNNSEPTTTTFQTGSSGDIGGSNRTMIAYCFAEKTGYSKFGSYEGNNNADGTFIYTGFKPRFIHMKDVDQAASPVWIDMTNNSFTNPHKGRLYTDGNSAIGSSVVMDGLSNGFKLRTTLGNCNSASTFIYMAFAEAPLVGTNGVTAKAR
tara:strand:+ start:18 stop:1061 length:1044 start_codon:yes stop_codon:yes gene_type:complete